MNIKCGRKTYTVTEKDYIMSNGACLQLLLYSEMLRPLYLRDTPPRVSIALFKRLLKEGKIKEFENKEGYAECVYYRFVLEGNK
ncbi:MAG: hypothetical protein ACRDA3_12935 [Peptostreptococcaceae bacterium]